jgi:hypothetical protein
MDLCPCESEENDHGVGSGEYTTLCVYYSVVRYTIVNRSHRICCRKGKGLVVKKTHGPVWMRERGS